MKQAYPKMKITRVDKYVFETDDGQVFEHPIPLDVVPSLEEFQSMHNECNNFVNNLLIGEIDEE